MTLDGYRKIEMDNDEENNTYVIMCVMTSGITHYYFKTTGNT